MSTESKRKRKASRSSTKEKSDFDRRSPRVSMAIGDKLPECIITTNSIEYCHDCGRPIVVFRASMNDLIELGLMEILHEEEGIEREKTLIKEKEIIAKIKEASIKDKTMDVEDHLGKAYDVGMFWLENKAMDECERIDLPEFAIYLNGELALRRYNADTKTIEECCCYWSKYTFSAPTKKLILKIN